MNLDINISQNTEQYGKAAYTLIFEFYGIIMANFLVIFVPKKCGEEICMIRDNIHQKNILHSIGLYHNILSFILILFFYYIEFSRERWCIKNLDVDDLRSLVYLDNEIEKYPVLKRDIRQMNKRYFNVLVICSINQIVNIVISIPDIYKNNIGWATVTPFISYVIVIGNKLYNSYDISYKSLYQERVLSAYITDPITFNIVELDKTDKSDKLEKSKISNISTIVEL